MIKQVGPATLELEERGDGIYINAQVNMIKEVWMGTAAFPLEAADEAFIQMYLLLFPKPSLMKNSPLFSPAASTMATMCPMV